MNCSSCGTNLPPGAATCPVCGMATPYNVANQGQPPYQGAPSAPPYGTPPPQQPYAPTYGPAPYGNAPTPATNYGPGPQPYGQTPYGASNPYAPTDPYSAPVLAQPPVYPGSYPPPAQPPRRRSRLGLIIGLIALVVVLACAGLITFVVIQAKNAATNLLATATVVSSTVTTQQAGPSGSPVSLSASKILNSPKMASAIDSNYNPTTLATTFATNKYVYVTFGIDTGGVAGYAEAKWYINGQLADSNQPFAIQASYDHGFFRGGPFTTPGNGTVEMYWCTQANCSDAQLANIATFTVTATGSYMTSPALVSRNDINRTN